MRGPDRTGRQRRPTLPGDGILAEFPASRRGAGRQSAWSEHQSRQPPPQGTSLLEPGRRARRFPCVGRENGLPPAAGKGMTLRRQRVVQNLVGGHFSCMGGVLWAEPVREQGGDEPRTGRRCARSASGAAPCWLWSRCPARSRRSSPRDCRVRGDGLRHAVQVVAHMHVEAVTRGSSEVTAEGPGLRSGRQDWLRPLSGRAAGGRPR